MKNSTTESKKTVMADKTLRVSGMQVRSGVKAGRRWDAGNAGDGIHGRRSTTSPLERF